MLIEAKVQPRRRAELIEALREYLPLVRAELGSKPFTSPREKTTQIRLSFTKSTSRTLHRISICSRILRRNSWRCSRAHRQQTACGQISLSCRMQYWTNLKANSLARPTSAELRYDCLHL